MNYKVLKKKNNYDEAITELGDFLFSSKHFFHIFIRVINHNKKDVLDSLKKKYLTVGIIKPEEYSEFAKLWNKFQYSINSKKVNQGDLMEYLICKIGKPLILSFKDTGYECNCVVISKNNSKIHSNNCDFDIVLYDLETANINELFVEFDDLVEFTECKNDVNTFLHINTVTDQVNTDCKKKLDLFMEVKNHIGIYNVKYIFTSFIKPKGLYSTYLKNNGYGFIDVIDGEELEKVMFPI